MESIFVSIPSYKDSDVNNTIRECFERATHPERIWVGLLLQDEVSVIDSFKAWLAMFKWNSNVILKTSESGLGHGGARNIILTELFNDSDYFLSIDSHSRFLNDWDTKYIDLYKKIPSKGVISVFPLAFEMNQSYNEYSNTSNNPCKYIPNAPTWSDDYKDPVCITEVKSDFEKVITVSAGNLFGEGEIVDIIKVNKWKFNPIREQEIYSMLLFKSGYDIYATNKCFIFHKYHHSNDELNYNRPMLDFSNLDYVEDFITELKNYGGVERTYLLWLSEYYKVCDECTKQKMNENQAPI